MSIFTPEIMKIFEEEYSSNETVEMDKCFHYRSKEAFVHKKNILKKFKEKDIFKNMSDKELTYFLDTVIQYPDLTYLYQQGIKEFMSRQKSNKSDKEIKTLLNTARRMIQCVTYRRKPIGEASKKKSEDFSNWG